MNWPSTLTEDPPTDVKNHRVSGEWHRLLRDLGRVVAMVALFLIAAAGTALGQTPPQQFTATFTNGGNSITVNFQRHSIRSANFSVVVQDDNGNLNPYVAPLSSTYLGTPVGSPGAFACATIEPDGVTLRSQIVFEDGYSWSGSTPLSGGEVGGVGETNWNKVWPGSTPGTGGAGSNVYVADVGFDAAWRYFNAHGLDINKTICDIENGLLKTNLIYLRDASIEHHISRIVIRGSQSKDPYETSDNYLNVVHGQWYFSLPPSTHDTAVVLTPSQGGGIATLGTIATVQARASIGTDGDPYVVLRHELGHNWGAYDNHGYRVEGITIMNGNQLARISSPELAAMIPCRNANVSSFVNLGPYGFPIPPRASLDIAYVPEGRSVAIDVLANDHDANGDAITILDFDATSTLGSFDGIALTPIGTGGAVSRSVGTGPGGRDQLILQSNGGYSGQANTFFYRTVDSTGRIAKGIVYVKITEPGSNLALNRPVTSSSNINGSNTADKAVDGNTSSRWESQYSDPQWIRVDLGNTQAINRVVINWEASYSKAYEIQTSNDDLNWTTIYSTTTGDGGTDILSGLSASGRYVRMYGTQRSSGFGHSLWEFEVYSPPGSVAAPTGLIATAPIFGRIDLKWSASVGADYYRIKRAPASGGPYSTIGITNNTSFSDATGILASSPYYYVVSAMNNSGVAVTNVGEGTNSSEVGVTSAGILTGDATYRLVPKVAQNKAMDVAGAGTANGTQVQIWDWADINQQKWQFTDAGGGYCRLTPLHAPSKGLDVSGAGTGEGSKVQIWDWADVSQQKWRFVSLGDGWYKIQPAHAPTMVLDVQGQGTGNGTKVQLWSDQNVDGQRWGLVPLWTAPPVQMPPAAPTGLTAADAGGSQASLGWTASSGATSYIVKRSTVSGGPYTTIATGVTSTLYSDTALSPLTSYYYVISAVNGNGQSANSTEQSLSPNWIQGDIGAVGASGSSTFANNVYTVKGAGADIWGTADGFQFVSQTVNGDFDIRTRVSSQTNTNAWARAGIMIRDGTAANAPHVTMAVTPGNGFAMTSRATAGDESSHQAGGALNAAPNNWVRLVRSGNTFAGYSSANGVAWTQVGSVAISMGNASRAGLLVCSHASGTLSTATFDYVSVLPSPWQSSDIGAVGATGSSTFANNVYTVTGAGADIWGTADGVQLVSQTVNGDCDIRTRVTSQTNTNAWARAGIMIRDGTASNAPHVTVAVTPGNGFAMTSRATAGGESSHQAGGALNAAPNNWVRLVRSGNTFTGYSSADGVAWTQVGSASIAMASSTQAGITVCSHVSGTLTTATFDNVSLVALPSPWQSSDIGAVGAAGSVVYSGGVYKLTGSGADIWDTADEFRYACQPATGDCEIRARITKIDNTSSWAKTGVMIRESLSANSSHAMAVLTPGNGVAFQSRSATGGITSNTNVPGLIPPYWVRVVRSGNTLLGYHSTDGSTWTLVNSATITMATNVYIGLVGVSKQDGILGSSTIDNVTVTP
jgi:regulation of enolase protein 1 (concanavalin A-like superfamily)